MLMEALVWDSISLKQDFCGLCRWKPDVHGASEVAAAAELGYSVGKMREGA